MREVAKRPFATDMTSLPIQKCRCAAKTHGHKPGKCTNLATEPERLCKPCYDKTSAELSDKTEEAKTSAGAAGG
jgi:hypothetical protein